MAQDWVCPWCGCRTSHFSTASERYVCDACGYVIETERDRKRKEEYQRSVGQAKQHLQAGNWDQCCSIVRPMLNEYPAESILYLIQLAALTRGYEDYNLDGDMDRIEEAARIWDGLIRLGCTNRIMKEYAEHRREFRDSECKSRIMTAVLMTVGIILGFAFSIAYESAMSFVFLIVISLYASKALVYRIRPVAAMKELNRYNGGNPFRRE